MPAKALRTPIQIPPPETPAAPCGLYAGTSGWAYPTWKPGFYPAEVKPKGFLRHYSTQLNSVEVNYSFRKLPTHSQLEGWLAETSEGFRFSFKAPQRITHFSRLRDCTQHLADFYDALKPVAKAGKLGMILFQLPPNFKASPAILKEFLCLRRLRGKGSPPIAFEFRHDSWFCAEIEAVLRKYGAAYCIAETDDLITPQVLTTSGHAVFRLRRSGGYSQPEIDAFIARILPLSAGREVYVHFKHEDAPTGALNARAFLQAALEQAR